MLLHVDLQELFTTQHSVTSQNLVSSLIYIPAASDSHFSILVCMYTRARVRVCVCVCVCARVHVCMYVCMHMCIYNSKATN